MPNKWITHVKKYQSDHPQLNYKQAMQQAKKTYNKGTQQGEGFFRSAKITHVVDRGDQRYNDRQRRQSLLKSGLSNDTSKPPNAISAPVPAHDAMFQNLLTKSGLY